MRIIYIILIILLITIILYITHKKLYEVNGTIYIDNLSKPNYDLSNKKIAICISGQIRNGYEKTLLLQKIFLIDSLNADIFCCFEDTTQEIKQFIKNNLCPKKIIYVNDIRQDPNCKVSHGTMCMYNKIYLANQLKKEYEFQHNFSYDFVIRIRPDLIIKEHLPINIFYNNIENKIYMPIISKVFKIYGYPDFMAISNSHNMDIYSNIFNYLTDFKNNQCNVSETLLYIYLEKQKINGVLFDYPIQLYRFTFDNIDNVFNLLNYLQSLFSRYVYNNKCNIRVNI